MELLGSMAYGGAQTHVVWNGNGGTVWNWADYSNLFTVSPPELNFGAVSVGETGNQDFLLQNLTDAPISGTVQVAAPFTVTGGGQFTVGPGQSQNITIGFTPASAGSVSKTVALSSSVGVFNRTATGSGAGDTTAPETNIVSGPTGTIAVNTATFEWSGTDNVTTTPNLIYAYRLAPLEPNFSAFGTATTKSYSNLANGDYTFHVKAKDQTGNEDLSPASQGFTVNVPPSQSIHVIAPNGGEIWPIRSTQTIQWSLLGVTGNIKIELSRDGGNSWATLVSKTANDGTQNWRVTKPATTRAKIRVCSVKIPTLCDTSDADFIIQ